MKYLISICLLAFCSIGCKIPYPAARAYYDAVSPRYLKSIDDDAGLNADQKRILKQTDASFLRLLEEAK